MKKILIIFIIAFLVGVLIGYINHKTMIEFIDGKENVELNEAKAAIIKDREMLARIKENLKPLSTTEETFKEVEKVAGNKYLNNINKEEEQEKDEKIIKEDDKKIVKEPKDMGQLVEEIEKDINKIAEDLKNNKSTNYIKEVEFMKNYTQIKIKVNKKEYDESTNTGIAPLMLAITISSYQEVKGADLAITIEFIDIETGYNIKTYNY